MKKSVAFQPIEAPQVSEAPTAPQAVATPSQQAEFSSALEGAVGKIDALQTEADAESRKLAGGEGNLHETMLALEKADVAMKVAMKVRNKILDAYNEVMRMPV